jgi:uncharacterized protein
MEKWNEALFDSYSDKIFKYNHFGRYLRTKYKLTIQKITIDAGFTCPNRDGSITTGGCIYCDNRTFNLNVRRQDKLSVREQIAEGIEFVKKNFGVDKFIAYFQAFTNTYSDVTHLKKQYDIIREFPEIIGLSIGTRPDCIDSEKLDLIESYSDDYMVWVEYGLQTANDDTLKRINRGHTRRQFLDAVKLTENRKVSICVHLILGLPGESHETMMETADVIAKLPISGIKLHNLCVIQGTQLEIMYNEGKYKPLEFNEYIQTAVDFLERIPYEITVQRLTADAPLDILIAPDWATNRWNIIDGIDKEFIKRNSLQGIKC